MQFLSAISLLAATAVASPCMHTPPATGGSNSTASGNAKFQLMALRSASPVHFAPFAAAKGSVFLRLPEQNATCASPDTNQATFYLKNGGLYLYTADGAPEQQLYADRSGMGQGVFQYSTAGGPGASRNAERTAFSLDASGDLTFNGAGFIACPNSIDGAWSVWVAAGNDNPAGNTGCLGISVRSTTVENPVACEYTASS